MRILYDVDTQVDFMNKSGKLYVSEAELIKPNLQKLTEYAKKKGIPIFGSVDLHFGTPEYKHREGELQRWSGPFPDHCMNGTRGQEKIFETIPLRDADPSETDDHLCRFISHDYYAKSPLETPPDKLRNLWLGIISEQEIIPHWKERVAGYEKGELEKTIQEIKEVFAGAIPRGNYFEKQNYDVFTNPATEVFLKKARVNEVIVYGVATDYCVKAAVLGMQKRKIRCFVVEDAVKGITPESGAKALEEMVQAGAILVKTSDVLRGII